jgi:ABC-2 type transport system ATP-binding protein
VSSAILVRGLTKSYHQSKGGVVNAVRGIDLDVETGEIFALLGPNGAGKTSVIEILEGYRNRDGGALSVLGEDPAQTNIPAWRNRVGIVLQSTKDAADLTVGEILNHFAKYYSHPRDVDEVIAAVGLTEKRNARGEHLSGGQRRRLDVALGIIGNPELLFLDEPTTGFDPEARHSFWELIRSLRENGTTILMSTHYLDEAEVLADRVAVMNHGVIVDCQTPDKLGGRDRDRTNIRWRENGVQRHHCTDSPTEFIRTLIERIPGEIPELKITKPTLEEIYLQMIGFQA